MMVNGSWLTVNGQSGHLVICQNRYWTRNNINEHEEDFNEHEEDFNEHEEDFNEHEEDFNEHEEDFNEHELHELHE